MSPERAQALESCKPANSRAVIKMTTANAAGNTSPSSLLVFLRKAKPDRWTETLRSGRPDKSTELDHPLHDWFSVFRTGRIDLKVIKDAYLARAVSM